MNRIIIIGSGLAGYTLAKEFRKLDQTTPLQIITAGAGDFYSKPLLSTAFANSRSPDMLPVADATTMAQQLNAEIITHTRLISIDAEQMQVCTSQQNFPYSKLVLACGADVIQPELIGNGASEVFAVNDLETYRRWREFIHEKKRIVILGAGLVGCEFANDLLTAGYQVDLIAPCELPLPQFLPPELGKIFKIALESAGIVWHLQETATRIERDHEAYVVKLASHKIIHADAIISAIGLRPHTALAKTANLTINRGIVVDHYLKTSVEGIYALGDCAEVKGLVLLYVAPLLHCARALAKTLAGEMTAVNYPVMPIVLKTPACPIVMVPPDKQTAVTWQIEGAGYDIRALCFDIQKNELIGFVLMGNCVREKTILSKQIQP